MCLITKCHCFPYIETVPKWHLDVTEENLPIWAFYQRNKYFNQARYILYKTPDTQPKNITQLSIVSRLHHNSWKIVPFWQNQAGAF